MNLWIFDIDGVISEPQHRMTELKKGNHRKFYLMIPGDAPISSGIDIVNMVKENDKVVYATGRPEWTKDMTEGWMFKNAGISQPKIYYRKNGDYLPSPMIKVKEVAEILKEGGKFNHIYFVDDYPPNVKAVEEAFPRITGIIFKTWRLDEKQRGTGGQPEGVGHSGISII